MFGFITSLLVAGYCMLQKTPMFIQNQQTIIAASLLFFSSIVLLGILLLYASAWIVLQRAELKTTPRVTELFYKDSLLSYVKGWCLLFPLLIFFIVVDLLFMQMLPPQFSLSLAAIFIGITADAFFYMMKRINAYINPSLVVDHFTQAAKRSIKEERYEEVCAWIDAITEIGTQAVGKARLSLSTQALDSVQDILQHFLKASKSISQHLPSLGDATKGGMDTPSYVLLFALQRIELLHTRAANFELEPISSHVMTTLGKISLAAAEYDITAAQYPLHFMHRCIQLASHHKLTESIHKAIHSLVELGKKVAEKLDLTYLEIAPFYTGILSQLDDNSKIILQQDKDYPFEFLIQPFNDIQAIFKQEKLINHPDTPAIQRVLDALLAQYQTIQEVKQAIPTFKAPSTPVDDQGLSTQIIDDLEQRLKAKKTQSNSSTDQ